MSDPENALKLAAALRNDILSNAQLKSQLLTFAEHDAVYIPCAGNLGDGLIGLGTLDLFRAFGVKSRVHDSLKQGVLPPSGYAILGGGGGWFDGLWGHYAEVLQTFLEQGGQVLILPSTVQGFQDFFEKYAPQITIFAREQNTFDRLVKYRGMESRVHLTHDLAFVADLSVFEEDINKARLNSREGTLNIFREDEESSTTGHRKHNYDLSLLWNAIAWHDTQECIRKLRPVVQLLVQKQVVHTDRLHMSILATILGCDVFMYPSRYFKNQAVFDYSLSSFPNVQFSHDPSAHITTSLPAAESPHASDDIDVLRKKLVDYEQAYHTINDELQLTRDRNVEYSRHMDELRNASPHDDELLQLQCQISALTDKLEMTQAEFERYKTEARQHEQMLQEEHSLALREQTAFVQSRGYRVWSSYNRLYRMPVVGPVLTGLRNLVKKLR